MRVLQRNCSKIKKFIVCFSFVPKLIKTYGLNQERNDPSALFYPYSDIRASL